MERGVGRPQTAPGSWLDFPEISLQVGADSLEDCLAEVPKDQPDELWPPPLWPGHFCKRSLLQLRDSSGLSAQQPPYSFAVRYDLRPAAKQIGEKMAYLMLLDGETLRRLGKGVGLELAAACKSWVARKALCAPPQLLARDGHSKLVGEIVVQPDPHLYSNSEGVLLMTVVLTKDIRDTKLWQPAGDLISYRLGSPPVQCGLCRATVAQRELNSHQRECPQLSTACPRCSKRVPVRELATHQTGEECLRSSGMCTQTDEKETCEVAAQCHTAVLVPKAVQVNYSFALLAPDRLSLEPLKPQLVPSCGLRWARPPPQVREAVREYQLSVSERQSEDWALLRVELLDMERLERWRLGEELRHELTQLRPGTAYRLELQLRAPDGALGPKGSVTFSTPSRLAGFEGFSAEEKASLASAVASQQGRPVAQNLREQATQAGSGFIPGACKSEVTREMGVQAFPAVFTETGCQIDPIMTVKQDTSCGAEWPCFSTSSVQCKAPSKESSAQCEVLTAQSSCQAQFPPRPATGDPKAELEMDMQSGVPGWRASLQQAGFGELLRLGVALLGLCCSLAGVLLAELPAQEMWPMLASIIILLPLNALEYLFFEMFPPSRRAATKLRIWRRRNPNMNLLVQVMTCVISPDALNLYRAPMQPGGRRVCGVVADAPGGPAGDGAGDPAVRRIPNFSELCAAKCPVCTQLAPIQRLGDLWRSTRFVLYCHLPQLGLAALLLSRQLSAGAEPSAPGAAAAAVLQGLAALVHGLAAGWVLVTWLQYRCRRRAQKLRVAELTSEPAEEGLQLRWPGMEEVLCDAWFVIFHSFDKQNVLRIEMLRRPAGQWAERKGLQLQDIPAGHFWVSVLSFHGLAGLSMPLAMGHCEVLPPPELRPIEAPSRAEVGVEARPAAAEAAAGDDDEGGVCLVRTAEAEVQHVPMAVDAVSQFPPVPVELRDAACSPEMHSASEVRMAHSATELQSFDLPLRLEAAPEGLWLRWDSCGLAEIAPRLSALARKASGGAPRLGEMGLHQARFQLEAGRYELLLSCELGVLQAEVVQCPHPRCAEHFWAFDLEAHQRKCPWQPLPCPDCGWLGCRDELQQHKLDCPEQEVQCRHKALGCKWVGALGAEPTHLKSCEAQVLLEALKILDLLLSEACPDYRNPELVQLVSQVSAYKRFLRPGGQWKDWKSAGRCCTCMKPVDRKEKGLQCDVGNLRLCWSCVPSHMDWQRLHESGSST